MDAEVGELRSEEVRGGGVLERTVAAYGGAHWEGEWDWASDEQLPKNLQGFGVACWDAMQLLLLGFFVLSC